MAGGSTRILGAVSPALALALAFACSSSRTGDPIVPPGDGGPTADGEVGAPVDAASSLAIAMGATVAPTADFYHCKYVTVPADPGFFVGASHTYGAGAHHVLVFRTDLAAVPAGQDAERDCYAPDDVMPHARAQVYGAQTKTGSFAMPPATGLPLRAGEVLLAQVHYLNATAAALDARVDVALATSKTGITQRAGAFYFADPFIDVGPGQRARASMRCAVPADTVILTTTGYAHAHATDFAAFVDPAGPPSGSPYYHAPGSQNPLPLQANVPVAAGGHVRFACSFDDTKGAAELLAGPRNDADEACVLSGLYAPDLGDDVGACRTAPDGFGTGAATCAQTRACVLACPAGSAPPPDLGLGDGGTVDPCWQRCVVSSCEDASKLLFAERACALARCATDCAGGPSAACTTCTQGACPSEVAACDAHACP